VIGIDPVHLSARDRIRHRRLVLSRDVLVPQRDHDRGRHVDVAQPVTGIEVRERGAGLDHRGRLRRSELFLQRPTPDGVLDVLEHPLAHAVPHRLGRSSRRQRQQRPERRGGPLGPRSAETGTRRAEDETGGTVPVAPPEQLRHRATH